MSFKRQQMLAVPQSRQHLEDGEENKKVDFIFDTNKLNQESFLNKLTNTVRKISEK